jgi:conjugal transfer ATP-binding protein TraC
LILNRTPTVPTSKFIGLDSYVGDTGIFTSKLPGEQKIYVGCAYEMMTQIGGGTEFSDVVKNLLKILPDDALLQSTLACTPDEDIAEKFLIGKTHGGEVVQELIHRQAKFFESTLEFGWKPDMPITNVRRVIMTLAVPFSTANEQAFEETKELHTDFMTNLRSCGFFDVERMSPQRLVWWYRKMGKPYEHIKPVVLDPSIEVNRQIFGPGDVFDFRPERVAVLAGAFCAGVTCKAFPARPQHGITNLLCGAPFNSGPIKEGGGLRIPTPYFITTTIRVANQRKEVERVDRAIDSRINTPTKMKFSLGTEDPALKLADLQKLRAQCTGQENKYVYVSVQAFVYGKTKEQATIGASVIKGAMEKLGFDAHDITINTGVRWAQGLPLNYSPSIANTLACEGVMSATAASSLMPVYGDHPGNVTDIARASRTGCCLLTRRGSPLHLDIFTSDKSYNGVLVADSGSGKSFAIQWLLNIWRAEGTYVFFFDNGRSAYKYFKSSGGEYNEFGENYKPVLNPFTGLTDEEFNEESEVITDLIMLMCYAPGEEIHSGARIAMSECVKSAYGTAGPKTTMNDVLNALQTIAVAARESSVKTEVEMAALNLVPRFKAFLDSPTRGVYFKGHGTMDTNNMATAFELRGLGEDNHLKRCVMFFVLNMLLSKVKHHKGRKVIMIDEALDFLQDEVSASVMGGLYLKGRKDDVATWVVVQALSKLNMLPAAEVILSQSPWKLMLSANTEELDKVIDKRILTQYADDPYFSRMMKSLITDKKVNKFSEILIIGERFYEAGRLYVDPFTANLFSSEGDARSVVFEMMDQGVHPLEAIRRIMNDQSVNVRNWVTDFVSEIHKSYGTSIGEITEILKDIAKEKSHDE